jgi:hypothetical protein
MLQWAQLHEHLLKALMDTAWGTYLRRSNMSISAFNARLKGPLGMGGNQVVNTTESSFTSMAFSF